MSIIKQKYDNGTLTDLNNLKFKPNMDRGDEPIISKRIPTGTNPSPPTSGQVITRADDLKRISKILTRPEGAKYLLNNTRLNLAVDKSYNTQSTIKDKFQALKQGGGGLKNAAIDTLQTIASTLAQVPLTGTGTHFIKGNLFGRPDTSFNKVSKTTYNIGDPGAVKVKYGRDKYYSTKGLSIFGIDKVNYTGAYPGATADDYIKFFFEITTPGEQSNVPLYFRAFLDSFEDSYAGSWNSFNYIGRGEKFHTYQNFDRTINVSFKSAVATKFELKPLYKKLVYLASTTAPTYTQEGFMNGTIVRMNVGDYLSNTPGYISSVNYSWETRYPWEITLGKKDDNAPKTPSQNSDLELQELPHILNCSVSFTPIHTFTPQTGLYHYITNPAEGDSQFFKQPVTETTPSNDKAAKVQPIAPPTIAEPLTPIEKNKFLDPAGDPGFFGTFGTEGDESFLNTGL